MVKRLYKNKLKELRKAKGYTLAHVAVLSGVDKAHLSKIEKGYKPATPSLLNKLKGMYGYSNEQWRRFFAGITEIEDQETSFSSKNEELVITPSNTQKPQEAVLISAGERVQILTEKKEVNANFIWIPKTKIVKHYKQLRLSLK